LAYNNYNTNIYFLSYYIAAFREEKKYYFKFFL